MLKSNRCVLTPPVSNTGGVAIRIVPMKSKFSIKRKPSRITHAKSLRVIGQMLETAGITIFKIKNERRGYYAVKSKLSTTVAEWISQTIVGSESSDPGLPIHAGCFTPFDISRLDTQGEKERWNYVVGDLDATNTLSQLLRTLGDCLDRIGTTAFQLSWNTDSIAVDWKDLSGYSELCSFSVEKLQHMDWHLRLRRRSIRSLSRI
jgi:hypothetical protein